MTFTYCPNQPRHPHPLACVAHGHLSYTHSPAALSLDPRAGGLNAGAQHQGASARAASPWLKTRLFKACSGPEVPAQEVSAFSSDRHPSSSVPDGSDNAVLSAGGEESNHHPKERLRVPRGRGGEGMSRLWPGTTSLPPAPRDSSKALSTGLGAGPTPPRSGGDTGAAALPSSRGKPKGASGRPRRGGRGAPGSAGGTHGRPGPPLRAETRVGSGRTTRDRGGPGKRRQRQQQAGGARHPRRGAMQGPARPPARPPRPGQSLTLPEELQTQSHGRHKGGAEGTGETGEAARRGRAARVPPRGGRAVPGGRRTGRGAGAAPAAPAAAGGRRKETRGGRCRTHRARPPLRLRARAGPRLKPAPRPAPRVTAPPRASAAPPPRSGALPGPGPASRPRWGRQGDTGREAAGTRGGRRRRRLPPFPHQSRRGRQERSSPTLPNKAAPLPPPRRSFVSPPRPRQPPPRFPRCGPGPRPQARRGLAPAGPAPGHSNLGGGAAGRAPRDRPGAAGLPGGSGRAGWWSPCCGEK